MLTADKFKRVGYTKEEAERAFEREHKDVEK